MTTTSIQLPLGARVRVRRSDGTAERYWFRGSNGQNLIFEDTQGRSHFDVLASPFEEVTIEED
jgi:hypothetical protein